MAQNVSLVKPQSQYVIYKIFTSQADRKRISITAQKSISFVMAKEDKS